MSNKFSHWNLSRFIQCAAMWTWFVKRLRDWTNCIWTCFLVKNGLHVCKQRGCQRKKSILLRLIHYRGRVWNLYETVLTSFSFGVTGDECGIAPRAHYSCSNTSTTVGTSQPRVKYSLTQWTLEMTKLPLPVNYENYPELFKENKVKVGISVKQQF